MAVNRGFRAYGTGTTAGGRRSSSNSQDIQAGKVGRGGMTMKPIPYKNLCDALFPVLRERREGYGWTSGNVVSPVGAQAYDQQSFFQTGAIQAWYGKSLDAQNLASNTFIAGTAQVDWVFHYLGGQARYLIANTCSHTMQVEIRMVRSKRYQNIDPSSRWDTDLTTDGTLANVQPPSDTSQTRNTLGTRPGQGGRANNSFREYYTTESTKKYILEPGQNVYHTIKFPPFRMTGKQLNSEISAGVAASINPKTQYAMIFTKGVALVCDGADADVNVGATACVATLTQFHQYRAMFINKPYQTYNTSALPQAGAFATQQEINVETEGIEGYTFTT